MKDKFIKKWSNWWSSQIRKEFITQLLTQRGTN